MDRARDTPTAAATASSHPALPETVHEHIEWETAVAYHAGYQQALTDVAAGTVELHTTWAPIGRQAYAERVRERLEQMETAAAKAAGNTWRGGYPGGPVDWDTGRLVQRTVARPQVRGEAAA